MRISHAATALSGLQRARLNVPLIVLPHSEPLCACRQAAEDKGAAAWGPITQADLLQNLGISSRLEALINACPDPEEQEALYNGALRLVQPSSAGAQVSVAAWPVLPAGCQTISSCTRTVTEQLLSAAYRAQSHRTQPSLQVDLQPRLPSACKLNAGPASCCAAAESSA